MMKYIKKIPSLLTLINLSLGCIATLYALESSEILHISDILTGTYKIKPSPTDLNKLVIASYFIFAAVVIDFLDGFLARLLRAESNFGKQLDTLADMVTFGFVPGLITYKLIAEAIRIDVNAFNASTIPFYFGFLITIFSAIRLAKFNIDEEQQTTFKGLPTPASALFIASLPFVIIIDKWGLQEWLLNKYILFSIVIILCYLLTSTLNMFSLKFKHYKWQGNELRYSFLCIALLLIISFTFLAIPLIIILYILLSIINNLRQKHFC